MCELKSGIKKWQKVKCLERDVGALAPHRQFQFNFCFRFLDVILNPDVN